MSTTKVGDVLLGDVLRSSAHAVRALHRVADTLGQLCLRTYRTSYRCHSAPAAWKCHTQCTSQFRSSSPRRAGFGPSCTSRFSVGENRCSGSAVFSAVAACHGRGGRSGRRRVIAVKLPSQRFKSNEMPVAPDRVCPIRSSPVFGLFDGRIGSVCCRGFERGNT